MSTDRDVNRIVRSWLEDGVTALPDRVLDNVLDQLPATPQRRAWWLARRLREMNTPFKLALAAAAVVVVAIAGINLLPSNPTVGGPGPSPTPIPTASPAALVNGPLPPGRYSTFPIDAPDGGMRFTFTVGEGWQGFVPAAGVFKTAGAPPMSGGMGLLFTHVNGLHGDPCRAGATEDVPVGPTVDDLATALGQQSAYAATTPVDVTLGGYSGKYVDLQLPSEWVTEGCFLWGGAFYAQGPDNRWHLRILDVDGARVVVQTWDFPGTSAQDLAELQAIVDSIQIEP